MPEIIPIDPPDTEAKLVQQFGNGCGSFEDEWMERYFPPTDAFEKVRCIVLKSYQCLCCGFDDSVRI